MKLCSTCNKCSVENNFDFKTCTTCRSRDKKRKRKRKNLALQKTLSTGVVCCSKCLKQKSNDKFKLCTTCRSRDQFRRKQKKNLALQKTLSSGIVCCTECFKEKPNDNFKTCTLCRSRDKKRKRKRKNLALQEALSTGVKCCIKCLKQKPNDNFNTCEHCRKSSVENRRKRKKKILSKVSEGFRCCKQCFKVKRNEDFFSVVHRRQKLTSMCKLCREKKSNNQFKNTTKRGKCKIFWKEWKSNQKCTDCGLSDPRVMEADHVRGEKRHNVSHYSYWASNGGIPEMKKELELCEPRCRFCHQIITQKRRGCNVHKAQAYRQNVVNEIKKKIGECKECKRKVEHGNYAGFDFDHRDEQEKTIGISQLVHKSQKVFDALLMPEIAKCDLLCTNCHKIKTFY